MNFTSNESTKFEYWIEEGNIYINTICIPLLVFDGICLFILSCIWSCCLIYQLINDYRIFKIGKKSKSAMDQQDFDKMLKDASVRRVKKLLFLAICLSECGLILSITVDSEENNHVNKHFPHSKHGLPFIKHLYPCTIRAEFSYLLTSYWLRVTFFLIGFSHFCIITFARILTEYMCSVYDFFGVKPYLIPKLLLSFSCVSIIVFIGLFRQLVLFADIAIIVAIIYQFILLVIATQKLKRLLYKRLFDAQNFESQAKYKIDCFKRALLNYKYGSIIILFSLFLQILAVTIIYIHPIIMTMSYSPVNGWMIYYMVLLPLSPLYYLIIAMI